VNMEIIVHFYMVEKIGITGFEIICRHLLQMNDLNTLSSLVLTNRMIHEIGEPILQLAHYITVSIVIDDHHYVELTKRGTGTLYINDYVLSELTKQTKSKEWREMSIQQKIEIIMTQKKDYIIGRNYWESCDWFLLALIDGLITHDLTIIVDGMWIEIDGETHVPPHTLLISELKRMVITHTPF
jgi:hypothetical protein